MKRTLGTYCVCLATVGLAACSSASPPPPEGNASMSSSNGINRKIGNPSDTAYGGTVLDGTQGIKVSCTVRHNGTYAISGHIESAEMSLDVSAGNIDDGAMMTFYAPPLGTGLSGTVDSITSVGSNSSAGYTCTITPTVVKAGSIYAHYNCPTVQSPSNLSTTLSVSGTFLFTGCDR